MSLQLPRKRTLLAWHRWLGILSAVFLVIVSITGLILNHTERLKLDQIDVRASWILNRYGMSAGSDLVSYRIHDTDTISFLEGQLFYNTAALARSAKPVGIFESSQFTVVASSDGLLYLTPTGELIEKIESSQLPFGLIRSIGISKSDTSVIVTEDRNWSPDSEWLEFTPYTESYTVEPIEKAELREDEIQAILTAFQGEGVSLYRVILDLHSGRLFGWGGRTLMDLSAVAILLLITSGISGWLRTSRRPQSN